MSRPTSQGLRLAPDSGHHKAWKKTAICTQEFSTTELSDTKVTKSGKEILKERLEEHLPCFPRKVPNVTPALQTRKQLGEAGNGQHARLSTLSQEDGATFCQFLNLTGVYSIEKTSWEKPGRKEL